MKRLIIFDLDGTLLNTIADLAGATNHALTLLGYPARPLDEFPTMVGNGINKLFERCLPQGEKSLDNVLRVRERFLAYYDTHNTERTLPYPGIPELLDRLQADGRQIAVASNKYQSATRKLIGLYFPRTTFVTVLGQRDGVPAKPNPTIVYDVLALTGVPKHQALFVGDSDIDMNAAINAGVDACGVTWGFRPRIELEATRPAYIVDRAEEIFEL
ncbi:MAG: HAD-IA family hydrolase [Mediterranea sp.]|jgi:phosphoglycolate phosphatase|nr:HAD-IA family hydrolase [Mediterranea sp.]